MAGVSSFQLHFADFDIRTPGDRPDVLVAMNPAALKANLHDLPRGAVILADTAGEWFEIRNAGAAAVDLNGWTIMDTGLDSHVIDNGGPLVINPGEYKVIGVDAATMLGEGVTLFYQYAGVLLSNGDVLDGRESLSDSVVDHRHPRTAVGLTKEGRWFFFVGDGRNAVHSVGFTLDETARVLKSAGAVYALNLDGGGSSSIISEGAFWNVLSDGLERPVSYGVGAFPREVGTGK